MAFVAKDGAGDLVSTAVADLTVVTVTAASDGSESYMVLLPVYVFAYDSEAGAYVAEFSPAELPPGIYDLWIGLDDGTNVVTRISI